MKQNTLYLILILSLFLNACFKEDEKIEAHQPGDLQSQTVAMGQYYDTQLYFDLSTNQVVSSNNKDIYDLRFHCNDSLWHIRLNSSRFSKVARTGDTAFKSLLDTTGMQWHFDAESGNTDSLAIQEWLSINNGDTVLSKEVFILDRGINALGITQGVRKFRLSNISKNSYEIEYANLDNTAHYKIKVTKAQGPDYVQLNLQNGETPLNLEPHREDYNLLFTPYTAILNTSAGEKYPYLVTGALLNPNQVIAALDTNVNFDDFKLEDVDNMLFSNMQNSIGYKWKWYDFDAGIYAVLSHYTYIVRDVEGYYYKLRFIGFYNINGEKGYPKFEFQQL